MAFTFKNTLGLDDHLSRCDDAADITGRFYFKPFDIDTAFNDTLNNKLTCFDLTFDLSVFTHGDKVF